MIGKSHSSVEPGLGAHDAVGRDAAGVVAGDPGDEPRAHDRQEREQPAPAAEPAAQRGRADRAQRATAIPARRGATAAARRPRPIVTGRRPRPRATRRGRRLPPGVGQDGVDRVVDGHDPDQPAARRRRPARPAGCSGRRPRRPRPRRRGRPTATGSSIMTSRDRRRRAGRRSGRAATARRPAAPSSSIDVDVVDRLGVGLELAQPVDRLRRRSGRPATATNSVVIIPPAVSSG